ncbi:uncharacterized protein LOC113205382 [Frankliniella occidentalis]|uniref:Uncharacterized protein LOC113205382 n=1 Tax=Frankliniella occidentalis TaxID=133901 RepID=A0A9C6XVC4_FRAOC|nr:uncharacterized protein LOC113205382 [Frankliniella occidentalis]
MGCDGYAVLKSLELCVAIVCMIYKRISDWEAFQIFFLRQKFSDEWPLLNTITWDKNGSIYADITYGAFVIALAAMLLAYLAGQLDKTPVLVSIISRRACVG